MIYKLDAAFNAALTARERNFLICYCLSRGSRATCATTTLLRPFKQKDLRAAFAEREEASHSRIAEWERRMQEFDPDNVPDDMRAMFGSIPTKENFTSYCKSLIAQEKAAMRELKRSYIVCVDYAHIGKFWREFHAFLDPRVTFGDSNVLHEECDFWLEEEEVDDFLHSSLMDPPKGRNDWMHDWGNLFFGEMELVYEDLTIYYRDRCMLKTVSHEEMMLVQLEEKQLTEIESMAGGKKLAEKIRSSAQIEEN